MHKKEKIIIKEKKRILYFVTDLFGRISMQSTQCGYVAPKSFVMQLRIENAMFSSYIHHDAHEFYNFMLNAVCDQLEEEAVPRSVILGYDAHRTRRVRELFEGQLRNEMRCLCCESVTSRIETFLDLSLEIDSHSSVGGCLDRFTSVETLNREDKFYCEACRSLQEAQKRLQIIKLPPVLVLHLKRFKYVEELQRYAKLSRRVAFPFELQFGGQEFHLFAVVIHIGRGLSHGHYVTAVKSYDQWLLFDDERVRIVPPEAVTHSFGVDEVCLSTT